MKQIKDIKAVLPPLKLLGRRVLVSLDLVPFIHMLKPLALTLATLRNPPGMIYTKKIFKHLKRVFLMRTFKNKFLKNQQKAKFLLRGYQTQFNEKNQRNYQFPQIIKTIKGKFNLNRVKTFFQQIQGYANLKQEGIQQKLTFIQSIPISLERRRLSNFNCSLRMKKVFGKIIKSQRNHNIEECQRLYKNDFLKIRVPWTENIFEEIKEFGELLWSRYKNNSLNLLASPEKQVLSEEINQTKKEKIKQILKDQKIIKKSTKQQQKQTKKIKTIKKKMTKTDKNTKNELQFINNFLKDHKQGEQNASFFFSSFEEDKI